MKVHHLNCGSMCPLGCHWFPQLVPQSMVCHCLAVETDEGLILVDTGFGTADIKNPSRLGLSARLFGWDQNPARTAIQHIKRLGFSPSDVQHIILTHLDFDHAGGIADFPHAQVHVLEPELQAAQTRRGLMGKARYRPAQFSHSPHWRPHQTDAGEMWMGFPGVRSIPGCPPEILLVPLLGHTAGHLGVAVKQPSDRWLIHVGDAYYSRGELTDSHNLKLTYRYLRLTAHFDRKQMLAQQQLLKQHLASSSISLFCSHDTGELNLLDTFRSSSGTSQDRE